MRGSKKDPGHSHSEEPKARGHPPVLPGLELPLPVPMPPRPAPPAQASLAQERGGGKEGPSLFSKSQRRKQG